MGHRVHSDALRHLGQESSGRPFERGRPLTSRVDSTADFHDDRRMRRSAYGFRRRGHPPRRPGFNPGPAKQCPLGGNAAPRPRPCDPGSARRQTTRADGAKAGVRGPLTIFGLARRPPPVNSPFRASRGKRPSYTCLQHASIAQRLADQADVVQDNGARSATLPASDAGANLH